MIDTKMIARRIRNLRQAEEISQEMLAEWAHVSTTYINLIESGKKDNVSLQIMAEIAIAMQTSLDYLVFGRVPEKDKETNRISRLLSDCTEREKVILISSLIALKKVLTDNREE